MDKRQSDLVGGYKLETKFFHDHVRHAIYVEKAETRNRKVKEDWSNCGELGRGGFGVVYKQVEKATGRYRAVKAIDKRRASPLDCSREILVMAKLAKVCISHLWGNSPHPATLTGLSCGLMNSHLFFSIHHCL